MKNMIKCFLVTSTLVVGSFHGGWAMQAPLSNEKQLIGAIIRDDRATVARLLEEGVNVNNSRDLFGRTALILAVNNGLTEIVEMLLSVDGIDVNAREGSWLGETALMNASSRGRIGMVHMLLCANADVTMEDGSGMTAFDRAKRSGNIAITNLLAAAMAAHEWTGLPLDVLNAYIMPYVE
jgi:ankyrin repeat protein